MKDENLQISLKNVTKKYGEQLILENVDLKIYQEDFISIFGKSGSGKTTLLNIIGTLEDYETGEMEFLSFKDPVKEEKKVKF